VAASTWSPQQGVVLRTLSLVVALVGDLPLVVASVAWVFVTRASSDSVHLSASIALPVLSFVLCFWNLCFALTAIIESAARGSSHVVAAKLFGEAALLPPRSGGGAARSADDHMGVAPVAVAVGNPLQQPSPPPQPQPPNAAQQPERGDSHAPASAAAVVSSSFSPGGTCLAVPAAVELLSRDLGMPSPSLSRRTGFDNLQRIGELWARAATPEARRLADMTTFWSQHPALLPAALDGVLQSPLPPAWLRLLHALESAERDRQSTRGRHGDTGDCVDEVTPTLSELTSSESTPPVASSYSASAAWACE